MNHKFNWWNAFCVFAMIAFAIENLSVYFMDRSLQLQSVILLCGCLGTPGVMLVAGNTLGRMQRSPGWSRGAGYAGYAIVVSVLLRVIVGAMLGLPLTAEFLVTGTVYVVLAGAALTALLAACKKTVLRRALFVAAAVLGAAGAFACAGTKASLSLVSLAVGMVFSAIGYEWAGREETEAKRKVPGVLYWLVPVVLGIGALFFREEAMTLLRAMQKGSSSGLFFGILLYLAISLAGVLALCGMAVSAKGLFQLDKNIFAAVVFLPVFAALIEHGWCISILEMMTKRHWLRVFVPVALVIGCMLCSETMHLLYRLVTYPICRNTKEVPLKGAFRNFFKYRFLLVELIKKGIVLKYRRSLLGILWSLVEPLLTMIVLSYVFGSFFGKGNPYYSIYILVGRLMFTLFQNTTKEALRSIRSNAGMIKKVYVPKYMYPISTIFYNFVLFLISLIDLGIVMAWVRLPLSWHLLEAIVPIVVMLLLSLGVGMLLSTINVFFKDIEYLWNVFCLLLMYCSAVFYDVDALGMESAAWIFKINPVYLLIYNLRRTVMEGKPLDGPTMLLASLFAAIALFVGFSVFFRKQDEFIMHI